MADRSSAAGPTGLYNMRLGQIRIPAAPQFTINVRRGQESENQAGASESGPGAER
jgi:hypothetical protein